MRARSVVLAGLGWAMIAGGASSATKRATVTIKSVDSDKPPIEAAFDPKELTVDKSAAWVPDAASTDDEPTLEYVGPLPRTLEVQLAFEDRLDVRPTLAALEDLLRMDVKMRRPPVVSLQFDPASPLDGTFRGVLTSIGVKYTMFRTDGTPVRATARLSFKEAARVTIRDRCSVDDDCPEGQVCVNGTCQPRHD